MGRDGRGQTATQTAKWTDRLFSENIILDVLRFTYTHDCWSKDHPTIMPEKEWLITKHFFDVFAKSIGTIKPRYSNSFEKANPQK